MPLVSQTFDQLLDFTRTSAATFVGSNGLIQTTPASRNLLTWTQQFDNAAWQTLRGSISANVTTAPDGTSTADRFTEDNTTNTRSTGETVTIISGTTYTHSAYLKNVDRRYVSLTLMDTATGLNGFLATFDLQSGSATTQVRGTGTVATATIVSVGDGWYRCAVTGTVPSASAIAAISPATTATPTQSSYGRESYLGNGTSSFFLWGAQLEAASAATTYTRNNGGVFPPRFDYDPVTLAPKGLLIEEQRTNLATYSEQYDDPAWSKFGSTITANTTVSPDGTTTADTQTATATSGVYVQLAVGTLTNGQNYTVTRYVKAGTKAFCTIGMFGLADAYFDLANLTTSFTGTGAVSASITDAGNGWRRVSATWTWGAGTIYRLFFAMASSLSSQSGITVGDTLFLWGAQLEAGSFATSYIPTVASQVTRAADQCSIVAPNFAPWYNQSEGTFVFEGTVLGATGFSWPVVASDNTAANRLGMYRSGIAVAGFIIASNVTQMEVATTSVVANVPFKIGVTAQANSGNFSFNGNIGSTDTTITMPVVNKLSIGASASGSAEYLNGHIRSIRYYPVRLSNTQLQALTA